MVQTLGDQRARATLHPSLGLVWAPGEGSGAQ